MVQIKVHIAPLISHIAFDDVEPLYFTMFFWDRFDSNPPLATTLKIEAPQTGDSSSVALWMMVAICGLGCVVCSLKSKKMA